MTASVQYDKPVEKQVFAANFNNKTIGVAFKKDQKIVKDYLTNLGENDTEACQKVIDSLTTTGTAEIGPCSNGVTYTIDVAKYGKIFEYVSPTEFDGMFLQAAFIVVTITKSL